ncbi:hypothetical protein ACP90_16115 [Labrenzia sp. CP4]|jgi:hypothetical protein|nr:hypothetical protein ACP90_16115 [Labrenzia sp. CP4]
MLIIRTTVMLAFPVSANVYRPNQIRKNGQKLPDLTRFEQLAGTMNRTSISAVQKEKLVMP